MRRAILTFAILGLCFFTEPCNAQGRRDKPLIYIGPVIGYSITEATGRWTEPIGYDLTWDTGLMAGAAVVFNIDNHLAFSPQLLWQRKGFRWEGKDQSLAKEINPFAYYAEIPLLVQWDFLPYHYTTPQVFAGPSFGFLIDDGVAVDPRPRSIHVGTRGISNINSIESTAIAGVRYVFPAFRDRGYLELRYSQSLNSFLGETGRHYFYLPRDGDVTMGGPGNPDARHQVFTVAFGFLFVI